MTQKYEWFDLSKPMLHPPRDGEVREVTVPVQAVFRWSDMIADEVDEDGNVLSWKSGFIMDILPQKILYQGEESRFLFNASKKRL